MSAVLLAVCLLPACSGSKQQTARSPRYEQIPPAERPEPALSGSTQVVPNSAPAEPVVVDGQATPQPLVVPLSDAQIAGVAAAVHAEEMAQAKLARDKAHGSEVRQYAASLLARPARDSARKAKRSVGDEESPLQHELQADAAIAFDQLQELSGAQFDEMYLTLQVDTQRKVLGVLVNDLLPNAKSPALKTYLQRLKPLIEQQLARATNARARLAEPGSLQSGGNQLSSPAAADK